jgi:hypothetical protein
VRVTPSRSTCSCRDSPHLPKDTARSIPAQPVFPGRPRQTERAVHASGEAVAARQSARQRRVLVSERF